MATMTRRASMAGMLGLAAGAAIAPRASLGAAQSAPAQTPIPPEGIGRRIRHLGFSDVGGKPDTVQIMLNRGHLYVGHMFTDGLTVLDVSNPRQPKPVHMFMTAPNTRTHHMQVANDLMLLGNGANIVRMQSYDSGRGYFENTLADSLTNRQSFRSGLSIHDISRPAQPREIAFLEMPGIGINRLWWTGGRYAYIAAHLDGFSDTILVIVDVQNTMRPEIVSRWWLPGMNRAAGETNPAPQGKRFALHHMIVAGNRGYAGWRDGGFTIHDVSDPRAPKLLSHINWSPPFPGGTHTTLPLPGRKLAVVADEFERRELCEGLVLYVRIGRPCRNQSRNHLHDADADRPQLLRFRQFRSAQSAREQAWIVRQRGRHFRHVSQCRRARIRHQGPVRAEGDRLLGAAAAGTADRSKTECLAHGNDLRRLRDAGRTDVCQRLERWPARDAV